MIDDSWTELTAQTVNPSANAAARLKRRGRDQSVKSWNLFGLTDGRITATSKFTLVEGWRLILVEIEMFNCSAFTVPVDLPYTQRPA
jgi:hypothetical protein